LRKRICIIHNPASGGSGRRRLDGVINELRQAGAHVEEIETAGPGDGRTRARAAAASQQFDLIVAAGGDGTVHDVAGGLIGGNCPLGIIPTGTGNVFARELGLGFAPAGLARNLLSGPARKIPVGEVNGQPFLFVGGVGFDAAVLKFFEAANHRWLGRAGFVAPVLRALSSASDLSLRVLLDGVEYEANWIIVTRIKRYAADFLLAPEADMRNEQLSVALFSGSGIFARMRQLAAIGCGLLAHVPGVTITSCRHLTIEGESSVPVQIDGEVKGQLPLELGVHRLRLPVITPAHG